MTSIEWTEKTWNPVVGCEIESAGCTNCYAMKMASRIEAMQPESHYKGTTKKVTRGESRHSRAGTRKSKAVWTGKIAAAPEHIWAQPLKRKKPTTYFVNSMGDLFHPNVSDDLIDRAFAVMALSPQHTFQILTKHPERMRDHLKRYETGEWADLYAVDMLWNAFKDLDLPEKRREELEWLLNQEENLDTGLAWRPFLWPNVWLGVSVENAATAHRIDALRLTRASVRFISYEPALGPIAPNLIDIDWVICGGESGKGARPMKPEWARSLRDQCAKANVAFFFKQWGQCIPFQQMPDSKHSGDPSDYFRGVKSMDPKTLDGVSYHEFPSIGDA